ncbi:MAG: helix-turn-helix domain-containing protein [Patulibacter sp.]
MNSFDPASSGAPQSGPWIALATNLAAQEAWRHRVVTEISDAIAREIPALGRETELRAAMRDSVDANAMLFATMAERQQDPTTAEPPALAVAFVRLLVHRGLPPETLVQTYRIAHGSFWRTLVGELRAAIDDPTALATALEHGAAYMFAFIDALTDAAQRRYAEERAQWIRSSDAVRAQTVRELLDGVPLDPEAAGRRLRYALDREHLALVAWSPAGANVATTALERALRETVVPLDAGTLLLTTIGNGLVAGWLGHRRGFSVEAVRALRPPTDAPTELRIAVGGPARGPDGFRHAHVEAMHARRVFRLDAAVPEGAPDGSRVRGDGGGPDGDRRPGHAVSHYADVAVTALATTDHEQARRFVAAQLGPLAARTPRARRLAETLETYLQERSSPRRTAARLGIHENTAAARVKAAEDALPGPVEGRVTELLLALRLAPVVGD